MKFEGFRITGDGCGICQHFGAFLTGYGTFLDFIHDVVDMSTVWTDDLKIIHTLFLLSFKKYMHILYYRFHAMWNDLVVDQIHDPGIKIAYDAQYLRIFNDN